jgi:hypothetical protein
MGQGLTEAPGTYSKLKDLTMGPIPKPHSEPVLVALQEVAFEYFIDDDAGAAESVANIITFLHIHYFPQLAWAGLTLNPSKSYFFMKEIKILSH